jgi:hypothetical protein
MDVPQLHICLLSIIITIILTSVHSLMLFYLFRVSSSGARSISMAEGIAVAMQWMLASN